MRHILVSILLFLSAAVPALAQDQRNAGIETTIQNQFNAFMADDVGTAFSFASPTIQGIFGTAENFGAMVKNGYPMVWRPGSVKYLGLRTVSGRQFQKVAVTDQAGALHLLEYEMIPAGDGWVIGGVQLLKEPDVGA